MARGTLLVNLGSGNRSLEVRRRVALFTNSRWVGPWLYKRPNGSPLYANLFLPVKVYFLAVSSKM
jgi:hypothetical protein